MQELPEAGYSQINALKRLSLFLPKISDKNAVVCPDIRYPA
jgi:hypothetical protein